MSRALHSSFASDFNSCNNPMGIYDNFEKAKYHTDELLLDKIHARV